MHSSATPGTERGFTLAELLIATVLMGLFSLILFNFLTGQSRFTAAQGARQEVDENVRGALELMSSELRTVPGGAILVATNNTLTFRLPRIWGVYCGIGNARHHVVFPTGISANTDVFPSDIKVDRTWGLAVSETVGGRYQYLMAPIVDTLPETSGTCVQKLATNFNASPPPIAKSFNLSGALTRQNGTSVVPPAGSDAFVYQTVQYTIGTSSGTAGNWLKRSYGGQSHPLAGPLQSGTNAVSFRYLCNGAVFTPTSEAGRASITAIQIAVNMQSRSQTKSVLQTHSDTVVVNLRNSGAVAACVP
jgi:prepilin-type N-terminal cleavage/methylation domain-containing protein